MSIWPLKLLFRLRGERGDDGKYFSTIANGSCESVERRNISKKESLRLSFKRLRRMGEVEATLTAFIQLFVIDPVKIFHLIKMLWLERNDRSKFMETSIRQYVTLL